MIGEFDDIYPGPDESGYVPFRSRVGRSHRPQHRFRRFHVIYADAGIHDHDTLYYTIAATDSLLAGKSATGHTHVEADITALVSDLSGKAPIGHNHDGTYVAVDADITAIAALSPTNDDVIQRKSGAWTNRTMAQVKTDLVLVKGDVGLGNVDNTADFDKGVSAIVQAALDNKMSQDDELNLLASLVETTDNVIQSVAGAWASRTPAQLKATLALAKGDVGLGSVDNTSDAAKPVSTATQTALDLKAPLASPAFTGAVTLPVGLTGVLRADSGAVSTDTDVTDLVTAASATVAGKVELATIAEATAGSSATLAITPQSYMLTSSLAAATWFLDEDNMASNSATKTSSQQAIKAYADTKAASVHTHDAADTTSGLFANARIATGTPTGSKFLRDDQVWTAPPAGGAGAANTATLAFGTGLVSDKTFAITDAEVSATSLITASISFFTGFARSMDEVFADPITFTCEPLAGSMTVRAQAISGRVSGDYPLVYSIGA